MEMLKKIEEDIKTRHPIGYEPYLIETIRRLRGAIEKHKKEVYPGWKSEDCERWDKELYKALEEE